MEAAGAAIVDGVERLVPPWAVREIDRILDAWGRLEPPERDAARTRAEVAGRAAAARVVAELRELFAADLADQHATPLQIVRTAVREPTQVLAALGVPPVRRDPFDEQALPADRYDLVPRSLGDLGDADLGAQLLVWGLAKSKLVRRSI